MLGFGADCLRQRDAHDRVVLLLRNKQVAVAVEGQIIGIFETGTNDTGDTGRADASHGVACVVGDVDIAAVVANKTYGPFEITAAAKLHARAVGRDAVDGITGKISYIEIAQTVKGKTGGSIEAGGDNAYRAIGQHRAWCRACGGAGALKTFAP